MIRPHPKPKAVKDPAWLKVVRQMPCWFLRFGFTQCNPDDTIGSGVSEVSHLDGKSRDDRVLPSCGGHHRTNRFNWHNGQQTFCRHYGVTKDELIAEAEALYAEWLGAK